MRLVIWVCTVWVCFLIGAEGSRALGVETWTAGLIGLTCGVVGGLVAIAAFDAQDARGGPWR